MVVYSKKFLNEDGDELPLPFQMHIPLDGNLHVGGRVYLPGLFCQLYLVVRIQQALNKYLLNE